ncbi:MAG: ATP-NAD kinase family protein [Halioglobus sp.]|nr:ATP-NAD kinase family protein [Halioglobus sp.]
MSGVLHIGLLINPLAGLGGSLALKGSDGPEVRDRIAQLPTASRQRALQRAMRALRPLAAASISVRFSCWAGDMGEFALRGLEVDFRVLGAVGTGLTSASDTREAAAQLYAAGVDLILFAGGDGTARDIFDVIGTRCPVLGIPAGVKMHSAVFAVSPEAAGELLLRLAKGGLVGVKAREVRDIDEQAFRRGEVRSRFYGEMMVPSEGHYLQHTKIGGREDPDLAIADIATWQAETMDPCCTYLIGPGSTTAAIMHELGLPNTLLGVDVVRDGIVLATDADEECLLQLLRESPDHARLVVTVIGGQGHLFGRGNQQFSPAVIRAVGLENITVVAAKSKLAGLDGRPLLVDTNDAELDQALCGYRTINTGYDDHVLYRVSTE